MQDILNIDCFWTFLGTRDILALYATCRFSKLKALQFKGNNAIRLTTLASQILPHLNTLDHSNFKASSKMLYDVIPEHDYFQHLNAVLHYPMSQRALSCFKNNARLALEMEKYFLVHESFCLPLTPGTEDITSKISSCTQAILGIRFHIPAGQQLVASLKIGHTEITTYDFPARVYDRIFEDQIFNQPLILNCPTWGIEEHVNVETNCHAELLMTHKLPLDNYPWADEEDPIQNFIVLSSCRTNPFGLLRVFSRMAGWILI